MTAGVTSLQATSDGEPFNVFPPVSAQFDAKKIKAAEPHPIKVQLSKSQATWRSLIRFSRSWMLSAIRLIAMPTGS